MKNLRTFEQFVNEGVIKNKETIVIEHEIEFNIARSVWTDNYSSEKELAENIITELSLKKGYIEFDGSSFEVKGETESGAQILAYQTGEYDMYGGPYDPKMEKPKITINGKDIVPAVKKEFDKYGWDSPMIDISRCDIWGHLVK
jgi:hypothetical protein